MKCERIRDLGIHVGLIDPTPWLELDMLMAQYRRTHIWSHNRKWVFTDIMQYNNYSSVKLHNILRSILFARLTNLD
jgi:hypothetical protein